MHPAMNNSFSQVFDSMHREAMYTNAGRITGAVTHLFAIAMNVTAVGAGPAAFVANSKRQRCKSNSGKGQYVTGQESIIVEVGVVGRVVVNNSSIVQAPVMLMMLALLGQQHHWEAISPFVGPPVPLSLSFSPNFSWPRPFGRALLLESALLETPKSLKILPCAGGSLKIMGVSETAFKR